MRDCTRKLRQERGASAVFALAIFLIVTLFSFTMVNGALTAAQNASMQRQEEQAYLTVTSAARLFCDMFTGRDVGATLIGKIPRDQYATLPPDFTQFDWRIYWDNQEFQRYRGSIARYNDDDSVTVLYPDISDAKKLILNVFTAMAAEADHNNTPQKQMSVGPDGDASWPADVGTVKVKLTMNADYKVTAEFSKAPDPDSDNLQYYVSVTLKCTKDESPINTSVDPVLVNKTLIWTVDSVKRGRYSA